MTQLKERDSVIDQLRQRVEELTRHLNLVDMVPRSRYDAANQDWLTAIKERDAARVAATGEIADLTAKLALAQMELRERAKDCAEHCEDFTRAQLQLNTVKRQLAQKEAL